MNEYMYRDLEVLTSLILMMRNRMGLQNTGF